MKNEVMEYGSKILKKAIETRRNKKARGFKAVDKGNKKQYGGDDNTKDHQERVGEYGYNKSQRGNRVSIFLE